ncbi:MAG: plasmid pRiA4b ORF-3 family protein [Bacteroidota bacterium]
MLDPRSETRLGEILALTDAVCREHLSDEYAALAREAAHILAATPGRPLLRGKAEGWACGLVRAVGFVNFLSDPASAVHKRTAELAPLFGISEATAANRDRDVRDLLDLVRWDPHWTLPSGLVDNPMAWMILVRGIPEDARALPAEAQAALVEAGLIPYAPADPASRPPSPRWPEPAASGPGSLDPEAPRVRLRVSLDDVEPEVWREVEVPSDLPLDGLHEVIQTAMDWEDYHLHVFEAKGRYWGPMFEPGLDWDDERTVTIAEVLPRTGSRLTYTYDFGDDWRHTVRRTERRPPQPGGPLFVCTDGAGACPPEDCGGPWGYASLLEVLADPSHPDHDEMMEWTGGPIDPAAFRLADVNRRLGAG